MMVPEGILRLTPSAPLTEADFKGVSALVDAYLSTHPKLHGVLIHAKSFPGWENFGAFTAHMHFVREHHKLVERVALATDSHFAVIAEALGKHFIGAEFRHFPYVGEELALDWLEAKSA
jgi:hypothetical protein